MHALKKVLLIFGTRPEAIKLAPVIKQLCKHNDIETKIAVTAQHREMLDQVLTTFKIKPDYDLNIMAPNQNLFDITVKAIEGLQKVLASYCPDIVLVQGDTTTTFVGSLAAYYKKIPVGHIEAGLRTGNNYSPFPEEMNRKLTGVIADLHFAPTIIAKDNLIRENINEKSIYLTGNTSIDALLWTIENTEPDFTTLWSEEIISRINEKFILVTTHRRESFGKPMENTMKALAEIANNFSEISIIFPVHFNPNVRKMVDNYLKNINNIILIEPVDYRNFVHLMNKSYMILTDSGGIQEEAPSLGKPIIVLRETTERTEGIEAKTATLAGTNFDLIVSETTRLLTDKVYYQSMAEAINPYGDGKASERIVNIIRNYFLGNKDITN